VSLEWRLRLHFSTQVLLHKDSAAHLAMRLTYQLILEFANGKLAAPTAANSAL
jgi:hypothetical protein